MPTLFRHPAGINPATGLEYNLFQCPDVKYTVNEEGDGVLITLTLHNATSAAIDASLKMFYSAPCEGTLSNPQPLIPEADVGSIDDPNGNQSPDIQVLAQGSATFVVGWQFPDDLDSDANIAFFFQGSYTGSSGPTMDPANPCNAQYDMEVTVGSAKFLRRHPLRGDGSGRGHSPYLRRPKSDRPPQ